MTLNIKNIVVFALLIRLVFVFATHSKAQVTDDAKGYDTIAVNLVTSGEFAYEPGIPTKRRTPVYPLALALIYLVFGHSIIAVQIIQSLISALTCLIVYLSAKKIFNETTALYSALITAIYPFFIYYTTFLQVETLFTFLIVVFVYFAIRALDERNITLFVILGMLSGLTVLTRPTAYLLVAFSFIYFVWYFRTDRKTFKYIKYMLLVFFIVILSWGLRNKITFGNYNFAQSGGFANMTGSLMAIEKIESGQSPKMIFEDNRWKNGLKKDGYDDRYYYGVFKGIFLAKPGLFFKHAFIKFFRLWRPYPMLSMINVSWAPANIVIIAGFVMYDVILILAFAGLYLNRKNIGKVVFLLLPLIAFSLVHMVFSSEPRFNRPVMPFVIILASFFVSELLKNRENKTCM